jgi:hypothetical protein
MGEGFSALAFFVIVDKILPILGKHPGIEHRVSGLKNKYFDLWS